MAYRSIVYSLIVGAVLFGVGGLKVSAGDSTPPVTTPSGDGGLYTFGEEEWANATVEVALSAVDDISNVTQTNYCKT